MRKLRNGVMSIRAVLVVLAGATVAGCGGGGGGGDSAAVVTAPSPYIPSSCQTVISEDAGYMACLQGTWTGTTASGQTCVVVWQGPGAMASYSTAGVARSLTPADYQRVLYQNGSAGLLGAAYWKDASLVWSLNPNQHTIELKDLTANTSSSCIVSRMPGA